MSAVKPPPGFEGFAKPGTAGPKAVQPPPGFGSHLPPSLVSAAAALSLNSKGSVQLSSLSTPA